MKNNTQKKLNLFKIALNGMNLIEASAGTGKTFTIVILYLRLLLGIGRKTNIKKLLVEEILVVTFTNAAKEELYIRIKNSIQNLYLACIRNKSNNPIEILFLKQILDIKEAIYILKQAKDHINNASIYTIHGFCQNILQNNSIHLKSIFQDKIVENENYLYEEATEDFWRRYIRNLPRNIIDIIYQDYKSPEDLLKAIKPFLKMTLINIKDNNLENKDLLLQHKKNIKKINNFKKTWLLHHKEMLKKISSLKINKKIYNQYNLSKWISTLTTWANLETQDYKIPDSLKYFTKKSIKNNSTNRSSLNNVIFEKTEKILDTKFSLNKTIIIDAIINTKKFLLQKKKNNRYLNSMIY